MIEGKNNKHDKILHYCTIATNMSAIGWVMIANSSDCLISPGWLASIAEGDSIINATLLLRFVCCLLRLL